MYLRRFRRGRPLEWHSRDMRAAAWLHVKIHERGLWLRPMLYAGTACDDSAVEAAIVSLY